MSSESAHPEGVEAAFEVMTVAGDADAEAGYGIGAGTVPGMEDALMLAAKPWAYWIAPMLLVGSVLAILAVIVGYVFKVVAAKYPKT